MVSNIKGIMVDGAVQLVDYTALANRPEITSEYSSGGTTPVNGQAVASAISGKADSATSLAGYGITDAKIQNGVITLGSNTITPLTSYTETYKGTVTSVNNVSPTNGNVTLSIPTVTDTYSATGTNATSGKAVASAISGKENTSNKVATISASSTDSQYPSAKCVYTLIGDIESILSTING